jgi:hypothetical protein
VRTVVTQRCLRLFIQAQQSRLQVEHDFGDTWAYPLLHVLELLLKQCLQFSAHEGGHLSADECGIVFQLPRAFQDLAAVGLVIYRLLGTLADQKGDLHGAGMTLWSSSGNRTM